MTLRIYPGIQPYEELYTRLLDGIPAGNQWNRGVITLPLLFDRPTFFQIDGDAGEDVKIFINDKLVKSLRLPSDKFQVELSLNPGKNFIQVRSATESYLTLVVATNYATLLRGYSEELFYGVSVDFLDAQTQLNSDLSLRAVEHQIEWQDLLPPTRAFRTLAGKLAMRSLINETPSTRGVDDIVTAASNTTPVVRTTEVDLSTYDPSVIPVYSTAHDEGGFQFHVWVPSICVGTWAAFIKLMDNLDPEIAELTSVSDEYVALTYLGRPESHTFDFDTFGCSIYPLLSRDCLPLTLSVRTRVQTELALCSWTYPFDVEVEALLGRSRFDSLVPHNQVIGSGDWLVDTTGVLTGLAGSAYSLLEFYPETIISATIVGGGLVTADLVPGKFWVVLPGGHPGDSVYVSYLGSLEFDSSVPLDSSEESDPLTDGWIGLPLSSRLDAPSCLDTTISEATLYDDLDCCFDGPETTLAVSSLLDLEATLSITSFVGMFSSTAGSYWVSYPVVDGVEDVYDSTDEVFDG